MTSGVHELSVFLSSGSELVVFVPKNEKRCFSSLKVASTGAGMEPRVDVMGAPVLVDVSYNLIPGMVFSVFAWSNASIRIEGSKQLVMNCYRSTIPSVVRPLVEYHCLIHDARTHADKGSRFGPMVAICGRNDAEKHLVARSLCSYAARTGWSTQLVDLDCGASQLLGSPGTISAGIIEYPLTLDEELTTGPLSVSFFTGSTDHQVRNSSGELTMFAPFVHYSRLLMSRVTERIAKHIGGVIGASGAVVILPYLRENSGIVFLEDFLRSFHFSHVICVGDDFVFGNLHARISKSRNSSDAQFGSIRLDKITESFFCSPTDSNPERISTRLERYFFGGGAVDLQPAELTKPFSNIDILILKDTDGQVILHNAEQEALEGIVGCVGALFEFSATRDKDILSLAPFALARVQSIDANSVSLLISTHSALASEKLILVLGTLRWLTT